MAPVIEHLPDIGVTTISHWIFNCYLIHDGGEGRPVVVDAGIPMNARAVLAELAGAADHDPADLGPVVATHAHSDHVAGVPHLHAETGCQVHLPAKVRDYDSGEIPRSPGPRAVAQILPVFTDQPFEVAALKDLAESTSLAGYGRQAYRMPVDGVGYLADGDKVPGAPDWQVIATPGHTDDSISFYNPASRTLLSGDAVLTIGRRGWFNPEYVDEEASAATEERLRLLDVEYLLPGHGRPMAHADAMGESLSFRERPPGDTTGLRRFFRRHRS
jgi:glyoxylase-like metal-dependent hydrolase (beta-lactamase superfamily II)